MSNYIDKYFWFILKNKDLKIILALLFILFLFALMLIPINQNRRFEEDWEFYKQEIQKMRKDLTEINSKLDFQTATIKKAIDDKFNEWFDCYTY